MTLSRLRIAVAVATLFTAGASFNAAAQGSAASGAASTPPGTPPAASTSKSAGKDALVRGDRKFLETAAEGGMAEVALGNLAKEKAGSEQVKRFGAQMAEDHGRANGELKQLATAKGVQLPAEPSRKHQREMDKLSKLSGAEFDKAYMKSMVADHKNDVSEFEKASRSSNDADVKALATKTVPTLREHLKMAQDIEAGTRGGKSMDKGAAAPGSMSMPASGASTAK